MAKIKHKNKAANAREVILDTAIRLFSERGYTGTTMRDIAEEVGVLPGSLYAHIKGKEELLAEIVTTGIKQFLDLQKAVETSNNSPEEKLRQVIKSHIGIAARDPERTLVVFHQWRFLAEPNRSSAVKMRRQYAKMITDILVEHAQSIGRDLDNHIKIQCFTVLGALNWTPEWYDPNGPLSPDQLGDLMADSLIGGLNL